MEGTIAVDDAIAYSIARCGQHRKESTEACRRNPHGNASALNEVFTRAVFPVPDFMRTGVFHFIKPNYESGSLNRNIKSNFPFHPASLAVLNGTIQILDRELPINQDSNITLVNHFPE